MARGRKASEFHVCNKNSPDDKGNWKIKEGQEIDFNSDLSTERIIVECDKCGGVKQCLFEKLNENHFVGTSYKLPDGVWGKIQKIESTKKNEERVKQIENIASQLKEKAAKKDKISALKDQIINGKISITAKSSDSE